MKQCPQCRNTYTDDTLKFCLADGAVLERIDEQETAVRQGVRVDIPPPGSASASLPSPHARPKSGGAAIKIVIAVLVLGFLALVAAGGAGVLYYMNSAGGPAVAKTTPTPTPTPRPTETVSPTPDDEQERLEKELANVLKQLEDELKPNANRSTPPPASDDDVTDGRPTARVNSPNDGFLAMREEPDADSSMLARIPHGSTVSLENCEKQKTTVGGRSGRWCMVTYGDETGWVFDAWLQYGS